MKYILILLVLAPTIAFADALSCGEKFSIRGKYQGRNSNGIEVFVGQDSQKVLFSFNNCYVILD